MFRSGPRTSAGETTENLPNPRAKNPRTWDRVTPRRGGSSGHDMVRYDPAVHGLGGEPKQTTCSENGSKMLWKMLRGMLQDQDMFQEMLKIVSRGIFAQ